MGENNAIDIPFHCDYGKNIFLGSNVIINMNGTFVVNQTTRIGDQVLIASNVQIYTATHPVLPEEHLVKSCKKQNTTFLGLMSEPLRLRTMYGSVEEPLFCLELPLGKILLLEQGVL